MGGYTPHPFAQWQRKRQAVEGDRKVRQSRSQPCCSRKGAARGAGVARAHNLLSRRWYILHYHRSTLLLPLGEVVAWWWWSGREERSGVLHRRTNIYILQEYNASQLYSVTDGGLGPCVYDYIIIRNTACMTKTGVSGSSGR